MFSFERLDPSRFDAEAMKVVCGMPASVSRSTRKASPMLCVYLMPWVMPPTGLPATSAV